MSLTINHQTNDISATGSSSVTIDGSAIGGGGGAAVVVGHTTTSSSASSVSFSGLDDTYIGYRLVMNWYHSSATSTYPNIRFYDGSTVLTGYQVQRYYGQNQSNQTGQSDIPLLAETSHQYFSSVVNIWGIGRTNKPLILNAQSYGNSSANAVAECGANRAAASGVTPDKIELRASWSDIPSGAEITLYGLKSS